jgi:rhodanese-related sulfurtransferase
VGIFDTMKNLCSLVIVLLVVGSLQAQHINLSAVDFKSRLENTPEAVLLDVRTHDEIKKGMIENAHHIDFFARDFDSRITSLDRNKIYFVYCAAGGRSTETVELMAKLGFKSVYNLTDGFTGWKAAKLPVAPYKN